MTAGGPKTRVGEDFEKKRHSKTRLSARGRLVWEAPDLP